MTSLDAASHPAKSRPEAGSPAGRTIVRLDGALDAAAASPLRERLIGLLQPGLQLLVLDLSRVPSCDSAGLAVLIGAERQARVLGIIMRLAAPSVPVAKMLRHTGLDRSLAIYPDLPGALVAGRPGPASPFPQAPAGDTAAQDQE